jgi:hypothetical protein
MKAFYLAAVAVGAMSVAMAQVSPEEHAAHHPDQTAAAAKDAPATKMPSAEKTAPSAVGADMQTRMKSMQGLMDKLGQTKDPAERKRLLAEHRQKMHEQLGAMMHMGCAMGNEKSGEPPTGGGMMGGGMMKCHELMQTRMDMMIGMMDQMMRHEEAQPAK